MHSRLILSAALALLSACGPKVPTVGEPIQASTPEGVERALRMDVAREGDRIAVEGYLHIGENRFVDQPMLQTRPHGRGEDLLVLEVGSGPEANQIDLAVIESERVAFAPVEVMTFDPDKLRIQDHEGTPHPLGQKLRVSGRLTYARWPDGTPRVTGEGKDQRSIPVLTDVYIEAI